MLVTLIFPFLLFALMVALFRVEQRFIPAEEESEAEEFLLPRQYRGSRPPQRTGPCVAFDLDVSGGFDGSVDVRGGEYAHPQRSRAEPRVGPRIGLASVEPEASTPAGDASREATTDGVERPTAA